jgi:xanthine dehydrogenase YagT iron-sulfur-binding subunit
MPNADGDRSCGADPLCRPVSEPPCGGGITRRVFIAEAGGATLLPTLARAAEPEMASAATVATKLVVNGEPVALDIDPRTTVLDLLRDRLGLYGSKKGCDHGQCGACTVLIDDRRANACLALAVVHDGARITTIEGLVQGDTLHPLQAAFIRHDGFQCGYCTPGQICSAVGMLDEARRGAPSQLSADVRRLGRVELSDDEIRERMSGNLCRCGAYPGIVAAVREVAQARRDRERAR